MNIDQEDEMIKVMPRSWVILRDIFLSHKEKGKKSLFDKYDNRNQS